MEEPVKTIECLTAVDTLYYSIELNENYNDDKFDFVRHFLKEHLMSAIDTSQDYFIEVNNRKFLMCKTGIQRYPYRFVYENKFEICMANKTGSNPPIFVRMYSNYLWIEGYKNAFYESLEIIKVFISSIFNDMAAISSNKINRIDICTHNTLIKDLKKYIPESSISSKTICRFKKATKYYVLEKEATDNTYLRYGNEHSLMLRIYDKTQEVINMQYKHFFFKLWYLKELISEEEFKIYDLAYGKSKNFNRALAHARFEIVHEYCKQYSNSNNWEIKNIALKYVEQIDSLNSRIKENPLFDPVDKYNKIIDSYNRENFNKKVIMPRRVFNIEYQLCRKALKTMFCEELEECIDFETGEIINDLKRTRISSVEDVFSVLNELHIYLTTRTFRVIQEDSAPRKKDCLTNRKWKIIQRSQVLDSLCDAKERNIVRKYESHLDKLRTIKNMAGNIAHDAYINDIGYRDKYNLAEIMQTVYKDISYCSENDIINFDRLIKLQYKRYGQKQNTENNYQKKEAKI